MRLRKPKPRKVQKYPEFWYSSDNDTFYFVGLNPNECFLVNDGGYWISSAHSTIDVRFEDYFEFIGEVKP